jgi:hypothetical protein
MCTSKNSNPFSFELENLLEDESLDSIVGEIQRINKMSFDTWYQSLSKLLSKLIPTIKINPRIIYEIDDETDHIYMGLERRKNEGSVVGLLNRTVAAVRVAMMPRTLKIEKIGKNVA